MGLSDLLNIFKKNDVEEGEIKENPFSLKSQFIPFRLNAYSNNSADLHLKLKNKGETAVLTSIIINVPNDLGMDQMGIQKRKEIRLGELKKQEEKELVIPIWATGLTKPGTQIISVTVNAHYRTYEYIINGMKKSIELRIVK